MSNLPDYVASAKPNPKDNRVAWWKSTAQTYAGIMLWFVFWQGVTVGGADRVANPAGLLSQGVWVAIGALVTAALLCHFLYYLVPGKLGMKTGLPLYIVGTSTYGVNGGFIMPGFLMGVLQFGWLAVNAYFSGLLLAMAMGAGEASMLHFTISIIWAVVAAFIGLKGIKYVAGVATFLPLIPVVILLLMFIKTFGGVSSFEPAQFITKESQYLLPVWMVFNFMLIYVIGFFATAGAAGCDMGSANRDDRDISFGGLFGIAGSTIFAGGLSLLIVAGIYGSKMADYKTYESTIRVEKIEGKEVAVKAVTVDKTPEYLSIIFPSAASESAAEVKDGEKAANKLTLAQILMTLLAVAAFPGACFSTLIAANSFKTTLPKVNPFISCGLGTLASIGLIVSTYAGNAVAVFEVIGASFGPICGAMAADYLLSGRKWNGPRAGFNMPGWISWFFGFIVGVFNLIPGMPFVMPCPPLLAFIVGFVLYIALAKAGMESETLEMPQRIDQ